MFGIVSSDSFEKQLEELKKPNTPLPQATVIDIKRGRGNAKEVPPVLRQIISEEAINGTPAKELSEIFGVSESSISAYKHDATSTASYHNPDDELAKANDKVRDDIITKARGKLVDALDSISAEKLADCKVRDVAGIAKDMSAIIRNLEPQATPNGPNLNQQFIFYAPKTRKESDFEAIDARE